jgi:hypothetical protein
MYWSLLPTASDSGPKELPSIRDPMSDTYVTLM